ncbi:hypothetical protein D2T30_15595 [Sinirhodobacter populi]|uniref:Uncharacterized protein n=1 Tax=Paenirhodobacter populi TaxID=2306993 RepID=A0A443JE11_9RHOB|nr:hypothetical protein D2T30_15595 [Sinirhodobacter populi]
MCRSAIICLMLLASCGRDPPALALLDLSDCPGWTGGTPTSERTFARAAAAEQAGRLCANSKLAAVRSVAEQE